MNSAAEKLAAIYHLQTLNPNAVIPPCLVKDTLNNECLQYNYVYFDGLDQIDAACDEDGAEKIFSFVELKNVENYYNNKFILVEVRGVGDYSATLEEHSIKVGCQTISYEKLKELYLKAEELERFEY